MQDVFRAPIVGRDSARHCGHTLTVTERLPESSRHYAKLKCANCGAFLKFQPRPENIERWKVNGYKLAKLQMRAGLNEWERAFVDSLAKQGPKFTPRQQECFDRICATYLKGGAK